MSDTAVEDAEPDPIEQGARSIIDESAAIYDYALYGRQLAAFNYELIAGGIDPEAAENLTAHLMNLQGEEEE